MVARVAASGIRERSVFAATSERAGDCGVADLAEAGASAEPLYGAGGALAATFFAHPLKVPHSTVTARAAKNLEFMNYLQ
jgi:hypothetical protein